MRYTVRLAIFLVLTGYGSRGDDMKDVREGEEVALECRFNNMLAAKEPTFYWTRANHRDKDNVAIGDTPLQKNYRVEFRPREGRYDLYIVNASYERDNGLFECRGKESGTGIELVSRTFQLTVLLAPGPPVISPANPSATEGKVTELTCTSSGGSPDPLVRWYQQGLPYPLDSVTKAGGSRHNATTAVLSITPQRQHDGAQFRCVVWNRALPEGHKLEAAVTLNVNYAPLVVHKHNKVASDEGEVALVVCQMQAFPQPNFEWSLGSSPVTGRHSYSINVTTLRKDVYQSVLRVVSVRQSDYGDYTCKAANPLGSQKTIVRLQPKGAPEAPSNLHGIHSSYDTVTLQWDRGFDGGYPNTLFIVHYQKPGAQSWRESDCQDSNPCNVTGLEQQQQYIFKVRAANMKGVSKFSANVTGSTKVDAGRIPQPQYVAYEPRSRVLSFRTVNARLSLVANIEVQEESVRPEPEERKDMDLSSGISASTGEGEGAAYSQSQEWRPLMALPVTPSRQEHVLPTEGLQLKGLKLRFCLMNNDAVCGEYAEAAFVDAIPAHAPTGLPLHYLIAIIVAAVVIFIVVTVVLVICCCRKKPKTKKDFEMETSAVRPNIVAQQPPPPYYPRGMENKGLENSLDASLDDATKNPTYNQTQNGYGYHHANAPHQNAPQPHTLPNGGVNMAYMDNSYSNSNNGGSVNSQDSLWQVKGQGQGVAVEGGVHQERAYAYDPIAHGGYGGFEEYSHYLANPSEEFVGAHEYQAAAAAGGGTRTLLCISRGRGSPRISIHHIMM